MALSNTWSDKNKCTLTSLGRATAPTVLHNLLRSHLELSLTRRKKEHLWLGSTQCQRYIIINHVIFNIRPSYIYLNFPKNAETVTSCTFKIKVLVPGHERTICISKKINPLLGRNLLSELHKTVSSTRSRNSGWICRKRLALCIRYVPCSL